MNKLSPECYTDSYKIGMSMLHAFDYAGHQVDVLSAYSNFTPRKNAYMEFSKLSDNKIVVYGTYDTFLTIHNMYEEFFSTDANTVKSRIERRLKSHFGSITDHAKYIVDMMQLHELGYLPIRVKAIEEGTRYNIGLPVFTVEATVAGFGWLVNYLETVTSGLIWPMINTATKVEQFYLQAKHYGSVSAPKEVLDMWLPICVHEFGMRGYRGPEDQIRTSSAHSLFFLGSDTIGVLDYFESLGMANIDEEPVAVSVRASEHADITRMLSIFREIAKAAIAKDGAGATLMIEGDIEVLAEAVLNRTELYVLRYFVKNSTGIMSYVSDTEDYYRLINKYAAELKEDILARQAREDGQPPIFVFRPDSSRRTPLTVICGYKVVDVPYSVESLNDDECFTVDGKYYLYEEGVKVEISKEEAEGSLVALWNTFGGSEVETEVGLMKLINPAVGLIYGEAISQSHQKEIYERMIEMGFSAVNVLMGKGSYASLENSTRDLFSMTYKQTNSAIKIDDKVVSLSQQKKPLGDISKKSARGFLRIEKEGEDYVMYQDQTPEQKNKGELKDLYANGLFVNTPTLNTIKDKYNA